MIDCPVRPHADQAVASARQLNKNLHQLRLAMKACPTCDQSDACPLLIEFHQALNAALQEIYEEWGLT
jgi:hypothetical protein